MRLNQAGEVSCVRLGHAGMLGHAPGGSGARSTAGPLDSGHRPHPRSPPSFPRLAQFGEGDVRILTGADEGAFAWLTLNYLLGRLGQAEESTVAAIDLGGGSVQEAFALTPAETGAAPAANYTMALSGGGRAYSVYVHSYLGYGLMAGRAGVLAAHEPAAPHPCVPAGYEGDYAYAGKTHGMKGGDAVDAQACSKLVSKSMNLGTACDAPQLQCTFDGAWAGDRVPAVFYISSYFWDRAVDAGAGGRGA